MRISPNEKSTNLMGMNVLESIKLKSRSYIFFREMYKIECFLYFLLFRVSLTLACPMNLKLYPLDRQKCSLRVASCKYQ